MASDTPSSNYFCGIDVAKRKHQALLLDTEGKIVKSAFLVTNDRAGFDRLGQELKQITGTVTVALEATGHYWLALYKELTDAGYRVLVFTSPVILLCSGLAALSLCQNRLVYRCVEGTQFSERRQSQPSQLTSQGGPK